MRPRIQLVLALVAGLVLWTVPAAAGVIRGHVFEIGSGKILSEARAFILKNNLMAITDSTGVFWLSGVPSGENYLRVQAVWHEVWTDTMNVGASLDTQRVEIGLVRVPAPGTVSGLITAENGAKPVRHAHVRVSGSELEGTSDDNGLFVVYGVPVRADTVSVVALGFDPVRAAFVSEEARNTVLVVDLGRSLLSGAPAKPAPLRSPGDTVACLRFAVPDTSKSRLPSTARVRLVALDLYDGERPLRKLMAWKTLPSDYTVPWDGRDDAGNQVPPGTYRYKLRIDSEPPIEGSIVKR